MRGLEGGRGGGAVGRLATPPPHRHPRCRERSRSKKSESNGRQPKQPHLSTGLGAREQRVDEPPAPPAQQASSSSSSTYILSPVAAAAAAAVSLERCSTRRVGVAARARSKTGSIVNGLGEMNGSGSESDSDSDTDTEPLPRPGR